MRSRWERAPRVIGHRGSPAEAPENTLASFTAARDAGCDAIELDVRLTRDGEVVVHHDATCGRTVPGEEPLEELDAAALRSRSAGAWLDARFAGERVPLLAEVLRAFPDLLVDVEIKADALNAEALVPRVADVVREARAEERVLVTSFDPGLAAGYHDVTGAPVGAITAFDVDPGDLETWSSCAFVVLAKEVAAGDALATLRDAGKRVLVWTVNDAQQAGALLRRGAEGIVTDRPGLLLRSLPAAGFAP